MNRLILDSNIIIGLAKGRFSLSLVAEKELFVSDITPLEVLGYHKIQRKEEEFLDQFFNNITAFEISKEVIIHAIVLRKRKSMSVGDAIIASTALIKNLPLVTANVKDFQHLSELTLVSPGD